VEVTFPLNTHVQVWGLCVHAVYFEKLKYGDVF
jgi:hypothetical protein